MKVTDLLKAFRMRLDGSTYDEIGKKFDVSRQYIQQVLSPPDDVKKYVVHRAQGLCQNCGIAVGNSGHIHHKHSTGIELDLYNDIDNLVLLCPTCHRNEHAQTTAEPHGVTDDLPQCSNCGHRWRPRKQGRPNICPNPKCHSLNWDRKAPKEVK